MVFNFHQKVSEIASQQLCICYSKSLPCSLDWPISQIFNTMKIQLESIKELLLFIIQAFWQLSCQKSSTTCTWKRLVNALTFQCWNEDTFLETMMVPWCKERWYNSYLTVFTYVPRLTGTRVLGTLTPLIHTGTVVTTWWIGRTDCLSLKHHKLIFSFQEYRIEFM